MKDRTPAEAPIEPWRRPATVLGLTIAAVLLFAFLVMAVDRTLAVVAAHRATWWVRLFAPDTHLDVPSLLLVPIGVIGINLMTFAAEIVDIGWDRSALRRVLYLETSTSRTDVFYFY